MRRSCALRCPAAGRRAGSDCSAAQRARPRHRSKLRGQRRSESSAGAGLRAGGALRVRWRGVVGPWRSRRPRLVRGPRAARTDRTARAELARLRSSERRRRLGAAAPCVQRGGRRLRVSRGRRARGWRRVLPRLPSAQRLREPCGRRRLSAREQRVAVGAAAGRRSLAPGRRAARRPGALRDLPRSALALEASPGAAGRCGARGGRRSARAAHVVDARARRAASSDGRRRRLGEAALPRLPRARLTAPLTSPA